MSQIEFSVWDYVVFASSLVFSLAIGIYYACAGGKQKTTSEYLMANRKMSYGPVALSVMVTFMSAISILGMCAQIYMYGTDFCYLVLGYFMCFPVVAHVFIPMFYSLKITSVFEYLEMRFSSTVKTSATILYIFMMVVYMGVVLYTPALALSAVTELNQWLVICVLDTVCIIYTSLGGLKAVIWTDVYQSLIMFASQLVIIGLGSWNLGGLNNVINIALDTQKMSKISMNPSPFEQHTLWTLWLGGAMMCITIYGVNQSAVQRYLSCKSLRHAQITAYLNLPLLIFFMVINALVGLVMYATYYCNNPIGTGAVKKRDQLLIYFVMDLFRKYPGIPGLFVASLFSAALSTISSCFNSLATVTMQDLVRPRVALTDRQATTWSKIIAASYGVLCLLMSVLASYMGSVLIAALSIFGIVGGPILGLFIFGMFFRCGNAYGALAGFVCSIAIIFWIGFGGIFYKINHMAPPVYEIAHESCENNIINATFPIFEFGYLNTTNLSATTYNPTVNTSTEVMRNVTIIATQPKELFTGIDYVYKLSYLWFSGLSTLIVIVVAVLVSLCTRHSSPVVDEDTLHPWVRKRDKWSLNHSNTMKHVEIELRPNESELLRTTYLNE